MHGVPSRLQTRDDYERMHAAALAGEAKPSKVIKHWQGLLTSALAYTFDRNLAPDEEPPAPPPEYIVLPQEDGSRRMERLAPAPNALITALGYTEAEVLARIVELEGM